MASFFSTPNFVNLGNATLTIQKLLSERSGTELAGFIPVSMPALIGSSIFEAHYLSLPTAAEVVLLPFVGHMVFLSVAPTSVQTPAACLGGASTVPLTTTFVFDDGVLPPVVTSVEQTWLCVAGGGITLTN